MVNVLVVEDCQALREEICADVARACSARVLSAGSLAEATRLAATCSPSIILSDLCLPDSRGLETFQAVRAAAPSSHIGVFSSVDSLAPYITQQGGEFFLKPDCFASALKWLVETLDRQVTSSTPPLPRRFERLVRLG